MNLENKVHVRLSGTGQYYFFHTKWIAESAWQMKTKTIHLLSK